MAKNRTQLYLRLAMVSWVALIITGFLWEWIIAPIREGGSWLMLKVLPLCLPLGGILSGRRYTYQYASMLVLLYFAEACVRLFDAAPLSRLSAAGSLFFTLMFFVTDLTYLKQTRTTHEP